MKFATEKADVVLPWTDDLPETFGAVYNGEDLLADVPELIWDRADGCVSVLRYHYHDHVCERFTKAFADNCAKAIVEVLVADGKLTKKPVATENNKLYRVQVGAFSVKANAEAMQKRLKAAGFDATIV